MEKQFRVKLIIRRAPALAALDWLKQSWQIFVQAPLKWLAMLASIMMLALLGSLHPILMVVVIFLLPFLTAGLYKAIVAAQQQKPFDLTTLFSPLSEPGCRQVFIRIAALNMLANIPLSLLNAALVQQVEQKLVDLPTMLLFVAASVLVFMIFAYAVAIAYFLHERRVLVIMQASLTACWRNIMPLLVFALLSMGLIMLTMPTMFIGLLVVIPLLNIAFFLSFNAFFALQINPQDEAVLEV